jgi:hypothetical protein
MNLRHRPTNASAGSADAPPGTAGPTLRHAEGHDTMTVRGDLRWFPTPSPWPWVAAGAAVAAGGLWLLRRRRWVAALTALVVVAVTLNVADVAGRIAAASWLSTDNRAFIGFFPAVV